MNLSDCGEILISLVSGGNSIIAEILRLKDYIPDFVKLETKIEQNKYKDIILDFKYFKGQEVYNEKIENDPQLLAIDDDIKENYLDLLTRFYYAFDSIFNYVSGLNKLVDELNSGYYIQQTVESVLQDSEGKQLLCEAVYLYGTILLITDYYIPGMIRERLLILHYRYSSTETDRENSIDDICTLLRSTGYTVQTGNKLAPDYPVDYFNRISLDRTFVDMVISRLKSDDIYNQLSVYPLTEHRPTALAGQASMLFIALYFQPTMLQKHTSQMEEIVNKFFTENWIVSIYMGITINLVDAWENFAAAKTAIYKVLEHGHVRDLCLVHKDSLLKNLKQTNGLLQDGILTEKFVLQHMTKILTVLRCANVNLRWIILQTSVPMLAFGSLKKTLQAIEMIHNELEFEKHLVFNLLLSISELELNIKESLRDILTNKDTKWLDSRREAFERISELEEVFSGERKLSKVEASPLLKTWFNEIGKEINKLSADEAILSSKKIIELVQALEQVQQFHNLHTNLQVKQYFQETTQFLFKMIQLLAIKEEILIDIQIISDLSYAWHMIDLNYTAIMQEAIKELPSLVTKFRATFLKLASALEIPLLRINQAKSDDLISVSKYYSNELANYIRKVIQIIPETMFFLLEEIISLQTATIPEIPVRLDKQKLKEFTQYGDRFKVSRLTYEISMFTEGITMMKTTLVGVVELDPKQLLEDGIRKELVKHLARGMNDCLVFGSKAKSLSLEMEEKLGSLAKMIDGYKKSFEYIQDYINIRGLKCIQEELSRIINYNVERECNRFVRNKIHDWQSKYQNTTIPVPVIKSMDNGADNFIGRLGNRLLEITDPKTTIYLDIKSSWYDRKTKKELLNGKIFAKVNECLGPVGLVGLNRLFAFMFTAELDSNLAKLHINVMNDKMWIEALQSLQSDLENATFEGHPGKHILTYTNRWIKVWPTLLEWVQGIGQKQILRENVAYELKVSSKFKSKNLENSLRAMNAAVLHEIKYKDKVVDSKMLTYLSEYLQYSGNVEPLNQIFVCTKNSVAISLFLFLLTVHHCGKLQYCDHLTTLIGKNSKDLLDGHPLIVGCITILQQYQPLLIDIYLNYLCKYASVCVSYCISNNEDLPDDVQNLIRFINVFVRTIKDEHTINDKLFRKYEELCN